MVNIPVGSMYAIHGNIYHQYTPTVSFYSMHGSYAIYLLWMETKDLHTTKGMVEAKQNSEMFTIVFNCRTSQPSTVPFHLCRGHLALRALEAADLPVHCQITGAFSQ